MFGDDWDSTRSIFTDDAELSCLPVDQCGEAHQKWRTQYDVRMHWCDTQRQTELHGRHLDIYVDELSARHTISVGYGEYLATMELVVTKLQLTLSEMKFALAPLSINARTRAFPIPKSM